MHAKNRQLISNEVRALIHDLGLMPRNAINWPADALCEYSDMVIDDLVEQSRKEHVNNACIALHKRNHNRKHGIDVYESSDNNLSLSFE